MIPPTESTLNCSVHQMQCMPGLGNNSDPVVDAKELHCHSDFGTWLVTKMSRTVVKQMRNFADTPKSAD